MEREKFSSRWGFLLISAGCAIGLGNVEIPTLLENTAEQLCLFICFSWLSGLIMAMEFAVGRASQCCASSLRFWSRRKHWHINGYVGMLGNYLLMMFYTTIGGWMLSYFVKMVRGESEGLDAQGVSDA